MEIIALPERVQPQLPVTSEKPKLRVIVALGKQMTGVPMWDKPEKWIKGSSATPLSPESAMTTIVVAEKLNRGEADMVIFSSGDTGFGSESQAMSGVAREIHPQIIDKEVAIENKSHDTETNAIETKKVLDELAKTHTLSVELATVSSHAARAQNDFQRHGVIVDDRNIIRTDDWLEGNNEQYAQWVRKYHMSDRYKVDVLKERVIQVIEKNKQLKKVLSVVTKKQRKIS